MIIKQIASGIYELLFFWESALQVEWNNWMVNIMVKYISKVYIHSNKHFQPCGKLSQQESANDVSLPSESFKSTSELSTCEVCICVTLERINKESREECRL